MTSLRRKPANPRRPTHAGGITFRGSNENVEYLLVGPSKEVESKLEWLLPKGHIEEGEGELEASVREVREETGYVGSPICPVGTDTFNVDGESVKVKYFLLEVEAQVRREETRRIGWFSFETAVQTLTHHGNKELLRKAERLRRKAKKDFGRGK
jgi:8-oxo-dGTP pyrophosphatase MutT (NUDIX family)